MIFEISSYLSEVGRIEDGTAYTADILFILAEAPDGTRYSHVSNFPCASIKWDEDTFIVNDLREDANATATRLLERIKRAGFESSDQLNRDYWVEIAPRYGSQAYEALGMEMVYAELERQEEGRL